MLAYSQMRSSRWLHHHSDQWSRRTCAALEATSARSALPCLGGSVQMAPHTRSAATVASAARAQPSASFQGQLAWSHSKSAQGTAKAPRTQTRPRSPRGSDSESASSRQISLPRWRSAVEGLWHDEPQAENILRCAASLRQVDAAAVASEAHSLLPLVVRLLRLVPTDRMNKAELLATLGSSLQAHPPLRAALIADHDSCATLDETFDCAAEDSEAADAALRITQLASAQAALGRCYEPFWRGLSPSTIQVLDAHGVAAVTQSAAVLTLDVTVGQPVDAAQQEALQNAIVKQAIHMAAADLADCVFACGALGWRDEPKLTRALMSTVKLSSPTFTPRDLALTLWGHHALELAVSNQMKGALTASMQRKRKEAAWPMCSVVYTLAQLHLRCKRARRRLSRHSNTQAASDALAALPQERWQLAEEMYGAFMQATRRECRRGHPAVLANTLWALAALQLQPSIELRDAIMERILNTSYALSPQDTALLFWGLGKLGMPKRFTSVIHSPLLAAAEHHSGSMSCQELAMAVWAIARLELRAGSDVVSALCSALELEAPNMTETDARMVRTALRVLRWPVTSTVRRMSGMEDGAEFA